MSKKVYDCKKCDNSGGVPFRDSNGFLHLKECECMKVRRALLSLHNSGIPQEQLDRCTLKNYQADTSMQKTVIMSAKEYLKNPRGRWFLISGQSGSGKTHICTALCQSLAYKGMSLKYMKWRDDSTRLKAELLDANLYWTDLYRFCKPDVLYIDDFWKGKVTEADINLAFQLLDNRYTNEFTVTIISTELTTKELLKIDEAVAGRIIERAKDFTVEAPHFNWRTGK